MKTLTLLPSSAAALAEARPGEEVVVRAEMGSMTRCLDCLGVFPYELEIEDDTCPLCGETACLGEPEVAGTEDDTVDEFEVDPHRFAPAAEGERVEVECRWCKGRGLEPMCAYHLLGYTDQKDLRSSCACERCETCDGGGAIPATVVSTPAPKRWCEGEGCIDGYRLVPFECCDDSDCESCGGAGGDAMTEDCSVCDGSPPYAWRLTLRRDGGGE